MNTLDWFPSWFPDIFLKSNEIMCCSVQDNMHCCPSTYPKCLFLFSSLTIIRQPNLTFIWEPTINTTSFWKLSFPGGSAGKESACSEGGLGSLPGLGRCLEERKATHSGILAWRGPWTVQSMKSQRAGHDWATFTSESYPKNLLLLQTLHFTSVYLGALDTFYLCFCCIWACFIFPSRCKQAVCPVFQDN